MVRKHYRIPGGQQPQRFLLRMPASLKERLELAAVQERRSENALVLAALEDYLDRKSAAQSEDQAAQ